MTLQTPPSWLQAGSYPAQYDRLTAQALWATTGTIGTSSLAVSPNSPVGMSVRVASGWAAIVGTTTTNMGVYTIFNDATDTLTITPPHTKTPSRSTYNPQWAGIVESSTLYLSAFTPDKSKWP